MSVRHEGKTIWLAGECRVEEAETLASLLDGADGWTIDMTECKHLHAAVAQALIRFRPAIEGAPDDSFVREMVLPALAADRF